MDAGIAELRRCWSNTYPELISRGYVARLPGLVARRLRLNAVEPRRSLDRNG
jgi:hypothetical protein